MDDELRNSPVHVSFWLACMQFAVEHEPTVQAFRQETGRIFSRPKCALDAMIDKACGVDFDADLRAFVGWASRNVWGAEYAPDIAWQIERGEAPQPKPAEKGSH